MNRLNGKGWGGRRSLFLFLLFSKGQAKHLKAPPEKHTTTSTSHWKIQYVWKQMGWGGWGGWGGCAHQLWNIYHYRRGASDILTQRRFNISSSPSSVLTIVRGERRMGRWVGGGLREGGGGGCTTAGLKGEGRKIKERRKVIIRCLPQEMNWDCERTDGDPPQTRAYNWIVTSERR